MLPSLKTGLWNYVLLMLFTIAGVLCIIRVLSIGAIFGFIRDVLGIRKDLAETEKIKLENAALRAQQEERSRLIHQATLDEVKEFDPKVIHLMAKIMRTMPSWRPFPILLVLLVLGLLFIFIICHFLFQKG
jgi:hypothetical protein